MSDFQDVLDEVQERLIKAGFDADSFKPSNDQEFRNCLNLLVALESSHIIKATQLEVTYYPKDQQRATFAVTIISEDEQPLIKQDVMEQILKEDPRLEGLSYIVR